MNPKPDLFYLFRTFLKVGLTSFGGYAALVAVVQNIMVERDKTIQDDTIVRGFSIASILPGPVAVNTVTYIGFTLAGWAGALTSMVAVILPSMVLMIGLAFLYERYISIPEISNFLTGVIPVVMAVILSAAFNIGKKTLKDYKYFIILVIVLVLQLIFNGYWIFILSFIIGGSMGYWMFKDPHLPVIKSTRVQYSIIHLAVLTLLLCTIALNFISFPEANINLDLATVFSGVSLTLFGGGYVMIPMLNDIIVIQKGWLTAIELSMPLP